MAGEARRGTAGLGGAWLGEFRHGRQVQVRQVGARRGMATHGRRGWARQGGSGHDWAWQAGVKKLTNEQIIELFEERAAIMEFDGGLSRRDAEQAAYMELVRMVGFGVELPVEITRIAG